MIRKLWTRGFRNLSETAVSFSESGATLIYGLNNQGNAVASGVYLAEFRAGSFLATRKMILMK